MYTAGKNFTLPPALTALTNFTSASVVFMRALKSSFFNKFFLLIFFFCNACCETNVGYCSLMSPSHPPRLPGKVLYLTLFYSFPCFFSFLSSKWISCLHKCTYMNIFICLCLLVDNENAPRQSFFSQLLKSYNRKEEMGDSKAL